VPELLKIEVQKLLAGEVFRQIFQLNKVSASSIINIKSSSLTTQEQFSKVFF